MATTNNESGGTRVESAPDDVLVTLIGAGDCTAFGLFYDRHAARVHGIVKRCLVDQFQSEEVTQEVFLEVWTNANRFDTDRGRAAAWLVTIAHRRAVDRVRSSQASRDRDLRIGIREYQDSYEPVERSVETRVEFGKVSTALDRLPDHQKDAIALAYHEGYSVSEIAERLGVPLGTVKSRIRDGLIRLRRELAAA
ncbi:sigma-70 family RNA polymerase sigma factor [soil metagenome]